MNLYLVQYFSYSKSSNSLFTISSKKLNIRISLFEKLAIPPSLG